MTDDAPPVAQLRSRAGWRIIPTDYPPPLRDGAVAFALPLFRFVRKRRRGTAQDGETTKTARDAMVAGVSAACSDVPRRFFVSAAGTS